MLYKDNLSVFYKKKMVFSIKLSHCLFGKRWQHSENENSSKAIAMINLEGFFASTGHQLSTSDRCLYIVCLSDTELNNLSSLL